MTLQTTCKIAQLLGAVAMIVGCTTYVQNELETSSNAWLLGGLLYGGGRLTAWFSSRER